MLPMPKRMLINGFAQCCPSSQSQGQWKSSRDRTSRGYLDPDFWVEIALTLERGCFDSLFFADVHGIYDVYAGNSDAGIRHAVQAPGNDPILLFPLLAHETRHLGLISTYSTSYYAPYLTAKTFTSLDHFTRGRVGWNIVTSYLESSYRNGLGQMLPHDERYDRAEEYMEVVYKLWERSWDDDAVVLDTEADVHTDPARVHTIDHCGPYFEVEGPFMCEASPQRTPLLVQAGSSPRGNAFGARHAEAQFIVYPTVGLAAQGNRQLRELAAAEGRDPQRLKTLLAVTVIVAETEREAQDKRDLYLANASVEGALALFGGWTGVDLSIFKPDDTLEAFESQGMQHLAAYWASIDGERRWTFAEMCEFMKISSVAPVFVGTPAQVCDEMERWMEEADVDGFNLVPVANPGDFADFVGLVVPELQSRGRMRTAYEGATLRENIYGIGQTRLPNDHPAHRILAGSR